MDKFESEALSEWRWLKPAPIAVIYSALLLASMVVRVPQTPLDQVGFQPDKIVHILLFSILHGLWSWVFWERKNGLKTAAWIGMSLGLFTEIVQGFIPWRSFDFRDLIADAIGIVIAYLLIKARHSRDSRKKSA